MKTYQKDSRLIKPSSESNFNHALVSYSFHSAADETIESPTLTQLNAEIMGIDTDIRLDKAKLATATSEEKVVIVWTIEESKENFN